MLVVLLLLVIAVGGFTVYQGVGFLRQVSGFSNPFAEARNAIAPQQGSIAWKLQHGQRVNLLLLGYGGAENDAPYLTDSIVVASLDPSHKRMMLVSIPRDLQVQIDAFQNGQPLTQKVNVAYSVGVQDSLYKGKKPEFTGNKDAGGRLAMQTLSSVTGLSFDGYVGVDFKAFRDLVNALGGVNICLDGPLDDYQYPDYHNGYVKGGIHFKAGCQNVNGEQGLQLARSRHATQPDQASDFGRSRRQQQLLNAIRKKASSLNAITKAPELMSALQQNFSSNIGLSDLKALYDWGAKLPDSSIGHVPITNQDFLQDQSCGAGGYYLCYADGTGKMLHTYLANLFVDPQVLGQKVPIQIVNGSRSLPTLGDEVTRTLQPLGLQVSAPQRTGPVAKSVVYDFSGGKDTSTVHWLASYFGASIAQPGGTPPTPNPPQGGVVVVLGHDYASRWVGLTG